jgi:hypothetical protein
MLLAVLLFLGASAYEAFGFDSISPSPAATLVNAADKIRADPRYKPRQSLQPLEAQRGAAGAGTDGQEEQQQQASISSSVKPTTRSSLYQRREVDAQEFSTPARFIPRRKRVCNTRALPALLIQLVFLIDCCVLSGVRCSFPRTPCHAFNALFSLQFASRQDSANIHIDVKDAKDASPSDSVSAREETNATMQLEIDPEGSIAGTPSISIRNSRQENTHKVTDWRRYRE